MRIIRILLFVFALGLVGYYFVTFKLLDVKPQKLKVLNITSKPYKVVIYRINGDATVQNSIQVREVKDGVEKVLGNYERYDSLISANASSKELQLLLKNPEFRKKEIDTLYITLP